MYVENRSFITKDGIKLYNVIIKPEKDGKYPIVLLRNPYQQAYSETETPENYRILNPIDMVYDRWDELVQQGYVLVLQHIRGTGNSGGYWGEEGNGFWLNHEEDDAAETMEWLRRQDFYEGNVFRWGGSYLSLTGMIDVYRDYPDLKGLVMCVPVPGLYHLHAKNGFYSTGMMGKTAAEFNVNMGVNPHVNHTEGSWRSFPQKDWSKQLFGVDNPMICEYQQHPREDDPFWREEGIGHTLYKSWETLKIPVFLFSAWYDHSIGTNLAMWDKLPEETRKKSAMLITPYSHSLFFGNNTNWPLKMEGSTKNDIAPDYVANWFNHILGKEELTGVKEGEVTYFPECGQSIWYYDKGRLSDGEDKHTVYLNSDGKLGEVSGEIQEKTYLYNPYNPASFYGGCGDIESGYTRPGTEAIYFAPTDRYDTLPMHNICLTPQDPPNFRYDVISFEGAPVEKKTYLKGGLSADIYVKSDCEDTCFYARLYVVKDGVTYAIRQDITSLSYQLGDYTPGTEVKLHFDFSSIVWALEPGDHIRLDISSSSYPNYSVHTNVKAKLQCDVEKPICAHNTIIMGKSKLHYCTSELSSERTPQVRV